MLYTMLYLCSLGLVAEAAVPLTRVVLSTPSSSTLKPRYNEPRYSEFCDIVNKTQLPF